MSSEATVKKLPTIEELQACLSDEESPIAKRMRSAFLLRQRGGKEAIDALASALKTTSVLLGHEIAYVLGQMQDEYSIPHLVRTLEDSSLDPIVRHEAAEALGAIGGPDVAELLTRFAKDPSREVSETCQLALDRLRWIDEKKQKAADIRAEPNKPSGEEAKEYTTVWDTVDPAPASEEKSIEALKEILCNTKLSLFERYRAMFALRNKNTREAVLALAEGFDVEQESALFRHEIAFVFGQMQHVASVPALTKRLEDLSEHPMVRHEAAEALGSIAAPGCAELLQKYQSDGSRVVRESCDVALDMVEYFTSDEIDGETPVVA